MVILENKIRICPNKSNKSEGDNHYSKISDNSRFLKEIYSVISGQDVEIKYQEEHERVKNLLEEDDML